MKRPIVSREEAIALAESGRLGGLGERPGNVSKFKIGNLQDIPEGEEISLFRNGDFLDLCAGPHVMRTGNIGAFKLTHVASAYYKGDEKNPQLQRIYGTAFKNKTEMEAYFTMLEEAKKRDHRKLGKEMELFCFDDDVGPGLPLWLPRGTVLIEELEKLAKETEFAAGYDRVSTPHLARENMYLTSGHLPYYAESMFPPMELPLDPEYRAAAERKLSEAENDYRRIMAEIEKLPTPKAPSRIIQDTQITGEQAPQAHMTTVKAFNLAISPEFQAEALRVQRALDAAKRALQVDNYYLKAMNCPHHHKLFGAVPRSYRDLPLRLAEYGTCYRYEQSGELFGLMRVRAMQMNDAHIYCTEEQFAAEFEAVNQMYLKYFKIFGIERYQFRFSTHDPKELGKKFVDQPELWLKTEKMVRDVLVASGAPFVEVANEAAFYGPKIDIQIWNVIGKEFTLATNQVDFAVPKTLRSRLQDKGQHRSHAALHPPRPARHARAIHRLPHRTLRRQLPALARPRAGPHPPHRRRRTARRLCQGPASRTPRRRRPRHPRRQHRPDQSQDRQRRADESPHMLVIGKRDLEAGAVSVRIHGKGNLGAKPRGEVIADLLAAIKSRSS